MYLKKFLILTFILVSILACTRYTVSEVDPTKPSHCWVVKISAEKLRSISQRKKIKSLKLVQDRFERKSTIQCSLESKKWIDSTGTQRSIDNELERDNNRVIPFVFQSTAEYLLLGDTIKSLLKLDGLSYIKLTPEPFEQNQEYIRYDLTAHNASGEKISNISRKVNPCPPCR